MTPFENMKRISLSKITTEQSKYGYFSNETQCFFFLNEIKSLLLHSRYYATSRNEWRGLHLCGLAPGQHRNAGAVVSRGRQCLI